MSRRVVVTGVGAVTAVGHTAEETWQAMVAGRSGIGPITAFDATAYPVRIQAEVKGFSLGDRVDAKQQRYMNRGVSACATCDGAFYKDVHVVVVGGGDSAMEEATFLTRYASEVTIVHRRDSFRASKIMADRVMKHPKIKVQWNVGVEEIVGDGKKVTAVRLKSTTDGAISEMPCGAVFMAIGHQPNTQIFGGQLELRPDGYIKLDGFTQTSAPGVFAAGDVADSRYRQAISAAGMGCMAAIDAEKLVEAYEAAGKLGAHG